MKKLLLLAVIVLCGIFSYGQYPNYQQFGTVTTLTDIKGAGRGAKGLVVGSYPDTTTANGSGNYIKGYPGALIFTTDSNTLWLRNKTATKWLRPQAGNIDITSFTFDNDTTGIICFSSGVCDTFRIVNLFNVVTNIVQNFNDSSVFHINDSTLLFCHGSGAARVCDTLHLNNSNTYNIVIHGDSIFAKTCDTIRTVCVGDNCTTSQLCDSILLSGPPPVTQYQNGVYKNPATNVVEFGDVGGNQAALFHNTILNTYGSNLLVAGQAPGYEPLSIQQRQISNLSSSIFSFNHLGGNIYTYPWRIDNNNQVNLYINYTDRFFTGVSAPFTGDSIGFMYDKIGYMIMGNSRGGSTKYDLDNAISKQNGLMIHTLDTGNTDAITIFGNQIPKQYAFSVSPFPTTTLLDSRIAVFHTDLSSNFLGKVYLTNGRLEPDTALITAANNLTLGLGNVNIVSGATQINAITTSGWQAGSSVIVLKFSGAPLVKNNTAGGAGTATILLAGRVDFQAAAGDVLSLMYDGTNWYETNRSLASGAGITGITADNGLTANIPTNVQLGGTLIKQTPIATGAFTLSVSTATTTVTPFAVDALDAAAIAANSTSGAGIEATGFVGGIFNSSGNSGITINASGGAPSLKSFGTGGTNIYVQSTYSSTNSVETMFDVVRSSTGTAANGIGSKFLFELQADDGNYYESNSIITKYITAAVATRTSQLIITGVNNAVTADLFTLSGNGSTKLNKYGVGSFTSGTATYDLRVDASGNVVEKPVTMSKGVTLEFPTSAESFGMWQTPVAITVSSLKAVLVGSSSPSVTYNIQFGTDRTSGTNVFTAGQTVTSTTTGLSSSSGFNDATIPAGSFIWLVTTAQSGTVTNLEITINYTED